MESVLYAIACVVVPMVWGLLVMFVFRKLEARPAKPDAETVSEIDLHERA